MVKILNDKEQDDFLEREGYVVLPFLNETEVKTLVDLYNQHHTTPKEGLYATAHSDNKAFKKSLNDEILNQFNRAIGALFFECRPLGGSYITKYKGERGSLFPHQDWTIVDEEVYRSFNIWVPLVDTEEQNGAICVLPKSHKLLKSYRGVNVPDPFQKVNSYTWQYHKTLNMKAGEALLYDHRLLHASGVNQTDTPRLAVVFGIIPEKAEMRYYYLENGVVSEYENSVEFFFNHDILKGPQGLKKLRDLDYEVAMLDEDGFDELYLGKKREKKVEQQTIAPTPSAPPTAVISKPTFFERVKNLFS